jgi:hypothetical protein
VIPVAPNGTVSVSVCVCVCVCVCERERERVMVCVFVLGGRVRSREHGDSEQKVEK